MNLTHHDLKHLADLAIEAAEKTGKYIAETRPTAVQRKSGGDNLASQMLTEVDGQSQEMILRILEPSFTEFDLALLTEESPDNGSRLEKDYFWCIDPIDGTLPYIEGVPGYAVSIALVSKAGVPQIGVVYDPVEHTLYHAIRGQGAFRNRESWSLNRRTAASDAVKIITDRSIAGLPYCKEAEKRFNALVKDQGGAVMNALWCLENPPACYFKFPKKNRGGGCFWDYAATACIYTEIGAIVSDMSGNPMNLNHPHSFYMNQPGILYATDPGLAQQVMTLKAAFPESE
jgi:fructose-1,6-bisphosphatase/inositol monophosphatase family enzyme